MYRDLKSKIHSLLDPSQGGTALDRFINGFLIGLILLNTLAVILETVNELYTPYHRIFYWVEILSVSIFLIEYLLRVWSCTSTEKYRHPVWGRLHFMITPGALIDLFAILPFFLPLFTGLDLRFIRLLRLIRFFRFFKLGRYLNASRLITNVFRAKKEELVLSFIITLFLIVIAASVMYYAEHEAQPNQFSSIPETMWWSVGTLTTAGFGEEHPITSLGKFLTACIAILGIGLFALPAGILASGFSEEFRKIKKVKTVCPHCGKEI